MNSKLLLFGLLFLGIFPFTNHTHGSEFTINQDIFIFVQTTVRNTDGQLLTYLESSKFTDLNLEKLGPFLDFEASRGNDPIVTIDEVEYQVIRRVQSKTFTSEDLIASTILSDNQDGELTMLARFAHDGYPVTQGDTLESVWTFIRPVS